MTAAAQNSVSRVPRSTRYSSYLASASQGSTTTQTSTTTPASSQGSYEHFRELRRYPYKNSVLPTKTSSYLELRRHRGHGARGMTMGQKVSGKRRTDFAPCSGPHPRDCLLCSCCLFLACRKCEDGASQGEPAALQTCHPAGTGAGLPEAGAARDTPRHAPGDEGVPDNPRVERRRPLAQYIC